MLWYSLEVHCQGTSNEYPQHIVTLVQKVNKSIKIYKENKKNIKWISLLSGVMALRWLISTTHIVSNRVDNQIKPEETHKN